MQAGNTDHTGHTHHTPAYSLEQVWEWLSEIPDPEIPVISITDLGIVRDVQWQDDTLLVTVTPTYTGCPATRVINEDITNHLKFRGVERISLQRRLSPAWTTDWLSRNARQKLEEYGIAAPTTKIIACPRCRSEDTECVSQFGSTPCKASYRCLSCLEPFDYFKCI